LGKDHPGSCAPALAVGGPLSGPGASELPDGPAVAVGGLASAVGGPASAVGGPASAVDRMSCASIVICSGLAY